jgi:N-acetylglutamate synthase-like GNAT family acetyltransferase
MMEIISVTREEALEHLNRWISEPKSASDLTCRTFMARKEGVVIAVACLRLCEGHACYFESLATNPNASSEDRSDAIHGLTMRVIDAAKKLGYKMLRAQSSVDTIIRRAKTLGFEIQPDISFFRRL